MKIDPKADQKLANGVVDLMMDAHDRGVDGMLAIVTVAAGLGAVIGQNVSSIADLEKVSEGVANGVMTAAKEAFAARLDKRSPQA